MSRERGQEEIDKIVKATLEKSSIFKKLQDNFRKKLNSRYHVLDISYEALYANIKSKSQRAHRLFDVSYLEFISAIRTYPRLHIYDSIQNISKISPGTTLIENPPVLINSSFDSARTFITTISRLIPKNKYFGVSSRVRTLAELVSEGYTPEDLAAEGRIFRASDGHELIRTSLYDVKLRSRELSLVDLGHTPGAGEGRVSPFSEQLTQSIENINYNEVIYIDDQQSIELSAANSIIKNLVTTKLSQLAEIQAHCTVSFKNTFTEDLARITGDKGFLALTLQLYTLNNEISVEESALRNELLKEIKTEITKVVKSLPGSNTLEQDIVAAVRQLMVDQIKGRTSKLSLPKHDLINTKIKSKIDTKKSIVIDTSKITIKNSFKAPALRTTTGQFTSLVSIQNLLNQGLASQIQKNMGTGERRDILNYRTGRFAESARVQKMSQSREGMITAFYSYMRNPYGTFSAGGQQANPATRDPKLLISRSIREIGATMVGNRMRAVLV